MDESQVSSQNDDDVEHYGFRDGNLFIVDVAPDMFESNSESGFTYFEDCLHTYGRILSQKLMWNKRDWMGLLFYNSTKNWDRDPETKHILALQKFAEVEAKMLSDLMFICDHKAKKEDYCDMTSDTPLDECLHDALWQALRFFDVIKIAMPVRQVVLLTRNDDPLPSSAEERHKIRLRAKTFQDLKVNLRIVGLGKNWNHELFYKDVNMLANNIEPQDAQPMGLKELESQVKFPAKTCGHLKWKITGSLEIPVFLASFSSKKKFLKKARMHKDTNEILDVCRHWGKTVLFGDDSEDEDDLNVVENSIPDYVRKAVTCSDKLVSFRPKELKNIRTPCEIGIKLLGFKAINMDPIYHMKPTKFMGVESSAEKEAKSLFAALFNKCNTKGVMAICTVTHRGAPYLASMIPCLQFNGFYLTKIPFREQINNLEDYTKQYIYDIDNGAPPPIDDEGVRLMKKIIKKLRMEWNPSKFTSPKLNRQLEYIETLALDTERSKTQDTTRPDKARMDARLGDLPGKFEAMFGKPTANSKRAASASSSSNAADKITKIDDKTVRNLIKNDKLRQMTMVNLKSITRSMGLSSTGLKAQLIERISDHCNKIDLRD